MLRIEDLYRKYKDGNIEDRITNYLIENDPQFKKLFNDYNDMTGKFEERANEETTAYYDDIIYQKLLLEEIKLTHAFKEGVLMATQISQESHSNKIEYS